MRGETTEGFLSMVAEAVASRVPHGTLETIADAGHLAPMERPEAVAERPAGRAVRDSRQAADGRTMEGADPPYHGPRR